MAAPAPAPTSEPPTYTLPNFYGRPGEVLTAGQGRLARPRFRYGASFSMGFDDNSQQTPDNQEDIPAQTIRQVIPAEPEIAVFQPEQVFAGYRVVVPPGPNPQPGIVPVYRTVQRKVVLRPAQPEQVFETEVPGVDFGERNASVVSRLDIHGDAQWANARSAFTMDLRAGAEYYWNRDEDPLEYNGSFSVNYLRRLNPRTQVSAALSLSYLSQPDYSQVNLVDTGSGGNYLVANAKLDLNYRWAPRWSTVTSLSGNSILYEGAREAASYWEATLGNELRWIQSRRTTWIIEARYSELNYFKQEVNSVINTIFLLVGADWTFGRKWRSTIRLGEASRSFESGGRSSSPYGEASLIYQPNRRDQFTLSTRYGYEATQTAEQENTALRVAGAYAHTFSPRLFGSLSLNYVRNNYTVAQQSSSSEIYDASAFLQYAFSRRFSMNARYSYVLSKSSTGFSDYDRSRFFLTAVYDF